MIAPLLDWFPGVGRISRAKLGNYPTPVEWAERLAPELWIKRDDLSARSIGGNKVRALEFLLGDAHAGSRVVTVGSVASTHAYATAIHARAVGASVALGLWTQEMNPTARVIAERVARLGALRRVFPAPPFALAWATMRRLRGDRWIPPGGTSPLGILGHVNAALEFAAQIERHEAPAPLRIIVPLGTGGTAAGLALGCRIAGVHATIVGVQVAPWIVARRGRVIRLANATGQLLQQFTERPVPTVVANDVRVLNAFYGGAYGREIESGRIALQRGADDAGVMFDATYSAKAAAAALANAEPGPTLLWLTFDGRMLGEGRDSSMPRTS